MNGATNYVGNIIFVSWANSIKVTNFVNKNRLKFL
jgi:hypothetical protein